MRLHGRLYPKSVAPTVSHIVFLARSMTFGGISSYRRSAAYFAKVSVAPMISFLDFRSCGFGWGLFIFIRLRQELLGTIRTGNGALLFGSHVPDNCCLVDNLPS